jgi:hypothetical protein
MEQQRDQQAAAAARAAAELRRHAAATLALLEGAAASTTSSRGRERQWRELLERQDPRGTVRLRREVLAAQRRARQPARSSGDDALVRRFHPEYFLRMEIFAAVGNLSQKTRHK